MAGASPGRAGGDAWLDLATGIIGAEERRDEGADLVRLRLDEHHHRITLRRAKSDAVAAIGWEVPSQADLESMRRKVAERGISVTPVVQRRTRGIMAVQSATHPDRPQADEHRHSGPTSAEARRPPRC
jgi:hypothetical protein